MPSNKRGIARSGERLAYVNGIGSFENPHSLRCACCRHPFFLAGPARRVSPPDRVTLPSCLAQKSLQQTLPLPLPLKALPSSAGEDASRGGNPGPALSWEGAMFSKATFRGLAWGQCGGAKAAEGARQHVRRWLQCTRGSGGSHPAFERCSAGVSPAPAVPAVRTPVCGVVAVALHRAYRLDVRDEFPHAV